MANELSCVSAESGFIVLLIIIFMVHQFSAVFNIFFLVWSINSKFHHHAHSREHGAAHVRELAEEVSVIVRRVGHRLALRREIRVDRHHGIGREVDVLHVEVEVERTLAEVKLLVHAQI